MVRRRAGRRRERQQGVTATTATADILEPGLEPGLEPEQETEGPLRRCLVTGEVRPKAELIRFAVDPAGRLVPDVAERLPGRGLWTGASRDIIATAVKKRLFARAARAPVAVEADLADRVEALLLRRAIDLIGLARRSGQAVQGFAKVEAMLAQKAAGVLIAAGDGSADGRQKLRARAGVLPVVEVLSAAELGAAFGRESAVHAALKPGRLADAFLADAARLGGFRVTTTATRPRAGAHDIQEGTSTGPQ